MSPRGGPCSESGVPLRTQRLHEGLPRCLSHSFGSFALSCGEPSPSAPLSFPCRRGATDAGLFELLVRLGLRHLRSNDPDDGHEDRTPDATAADIRENAL